MLECNWQNVNCATMKDIVIFVGPPGCGKGTQAAILQQRGVHVICAGDILRINRDRRIDDITIGEVLDAGKLLPDDIITGLVVDRLKQCDSEIVVLDGFPRTVGQAEMLNSLLCECQANIKCVLDFEISADKLVARIVGRFLCKKCGAIYNDNFKKTAIPGVCDECGGTEFYRRTDDCEETLRKRMDEYVNKTQDLFEYYDKLGLLRKINADMPVNELQNIIEQSVLGK